LNHLERVAELVLEAEANDIWINQAHHRKTWHHSWEATIGSVVVKIEELAGSHGQVDILLPSTLVDINQSSCFYGEGIRRRVLFGNNADELNDVTITDTETPKGIRFTVLVHTTSLQSLRWEWYITEPVVAVAVSEDINEQHTMVVVNPAQAPLADGYDGISLKRVEVDLHVGRDL
jgi:hypothetical protein